MKDVTKFFLPEKFQDQVEYINGNYKRQDRFSRDWFNSKGFYQASANDNGYDLYDMRSYIDGQLKDHGFKTVCEERASLITCWPGQAYGQHVDEMYTVHVPVNTNKYSFLSIGHNLYHFEVGNFYIANTKKEHSAFNLGSEPRTHILFFAF
tara:strand:+ start:1063 stop:1515 length:453 start_codon:yes stop_codon:yes gene_type:complete